MNSIKMIARTLILSRLEGAGWLAVHELKIMGVSDNAAATRLSEMAKAGLVEGRVRHGSHYKEWRIARPTLSPVRFAEEGRQIVFVSQ